MRKETYKTCPYCGAHLDPGETCDCIEAVRDRKHIVKTEEKEDE